MKNRTKILCLSFISLSLFLTQAYSSELAIPIPQNVYVLNTSTKQIALKWDSIGNDFTYNVYKSDSENGFYIKCDPYGIQKSEFIDTDITMGIQYWYRITAVNSEGQESFFSDAVPAKTEHIEADFQLTSLQSYAMQVPGLQAKYMLVVEANGPYSDDVHLSVTDLHQLIDANFSQEIITPTGYVTLTLDIPDIVSENRYTFHVNADGNNYSESISLFLDVKNPPSTDSAISAYLNQKQVFLNQFVTIYGSILPIGMETPLSIHIQHESEYTPTTVNISTDHDKTYQYYYIPEKTGHYTIFASWAGDSLFNPAQSQSLELIVLRGKSKITCQTPDNVVSPDSTVQITGKLITPELENAHIVLKIVNPNGISEWIENRIFTESDGSFKYLVKLDQEGIWEFTTCWKGNEQYQGGDSSPLRLYPGRNAGKALIVAGGGITNNGLWPTTQYLTTRFYHILLNRKYSQEMIHYISPDVDHVDSEIVINDQTPAVSDIQNYIESLYHNISYPEVNSDKPLLIYMMGHGGSKKFKVNDGNEILEAQDLDLWLDILQKQTACPVYIILEICYSGTFIDSLSPEPDQKRVIITSTGGDHHVAIYDNDGRTSFSQYLFNELNSGFSLNYSFQKALAKIRNHFIFKNQFPQIYDASNGVLARESYIGGSFVIGDIVTEIIDHTPDQILSASSKVLFVELSNVEDMHHVWASIVPPKDDRSKSTQGVSIPLTHKGNGRYEGTYSNFILQGLYRVTFFCKNSLGHEIAKGIVLNVTEDQKPIPGDLDNVYSTSHQLNTPSNIAIIEMSWQPPQVDVSGYCYYFNKIPKFVITDEVILTNECHPKNLTTAVSQDLTGNDDIAIYFHVAAVNRTGSPYSTSTVGPFRIDTIAPQNCSVQTIAESATRSIHLTLTADGAHEMNISNEGFGNGAWENYSLNKSWELPEINGLYSVFVQFKDLAGNICNCSTIVSYSEIIFEDLKPTNPNSQSHTIGICSNNNKIEISWSDPELSDREVKGYAVLWDSAPNTLPDKIMTTTNKNHVSQELPDGNYYVHIRIVDSDDIWSDRALHDGPYCIHTSTTDVSIPQGLTIDRIRSQEIAIKWYYMGDFSYNVYKKDSENGFFIKCDPYNLKKPEFIDTEVTNGIQYWYRITAVNSLGQESLFSEAISAKTQAVDSDIQLVPEHTYTMQLAGLPALYQIQVKAIGSYSDDVRLSVVDLHPWIDAKFSQERIKPPGFVTLTLGIPDTISEKQYSFYVNALGNNRDDKIKLFLDVKDPLFPKSAISAYLKKNQFFLNQIVEIYGSILPRGMDKSLTIHIQHESESIPTLYYSSTRPNKTYQYNFVPKKTGRYTIFSSWEGDDQFKPAQSPSFQLSVLRGKSKITCQTPDIEISPNSTVQITGRLIAPKIGNAHIILKTVNPDGILKLIKNRIYTEPDGSFNYSVILDKDGIWEIISCWEGNDQYQGVVSSPLRLYPGIKTGRALIVAGGGIHNNYLWTTTQYLTTKFYRILLSRKYSQDMIHYISPDIDYINPDIVINDKTPAVSDIMNYIQSLYQNTSTPHVNEDKPLLIYMADHGGPETFKINKGKEILKAQDLDLWLDDLQTHTACPVYIILEACSSGTFVNRLSPDSDQQRVIITSTGNHVAIYDNDGRTSFSQYLFNELNSGYSLDHSFYKAAAHIREDYLFNNQFPIIFDGLAGELAQKSYIGGSFVVGDILPEIIDHTPDQTLTAGSKALFVEISDVEGIDTVWASIMPPNFHVPEITDAYNTPIIERPKIPLSHQGNGRYEGNYPGFTLNGIYRVSFYCEDLGGNVVSKEIVLNVVDGQSQMPGDLDNNGKLTLCDAILSLQSLAGMDVNVDSSARILCNGLVGPCEGIKILKEMIK